MISARPEFMGANSRFSSGQVQVLEPGIFGKAAVGFCQAADFQKQLSVHFRRRR